MLVNTGKNDISHLGKSLKTLPIAKAENVRTDSGVVADNHKAIVVNGKVVSILTNKYRLVQHKEAFKPIIESVKLAGVKFFNYNLLADTKKAHLDIYTETARDDKEGIEFGFRCTNTFDGRSSIKFNMQLSKAQRWVELVEKDEVSVWGFRMACKNGMMVKVPLAYEKVVRPEERAKITTLLNQAKSVAHFEPSVKKGLSEIKYIIEALLILRDPIERLIKIADSISLEGFDKEDIIKLVTKYIGKKMSKSVFDQWAKSTEENITLWGLFNAVTALATHRKDLSETTRQRLYEKAADMLEAEIVVTVL